MSYSFKMFAAVLKAVAMGTTVTVVVGSHIVEKEALMMFIIWMQTLLQRIQLRVGWKPRSGSVWSRLLNYTH